MPTISTSKKRVTISWSGGKDSAFALYKILQSGEYTVAGLHTIINEETRRVGMHGVREEMMDQQVEAIGLPLTKLYLESSESHQAYNALMTKYYQKCANDKIEGVVFGDIFLEDLKQFRETLLGPAGLEGIYPLWKMDTRGLIHDFLHTGFRTLICAANASLFSEQQLGKTIDQELIDQLPHSVDPCGENGEFHTFIYDGPIFKKALEFKRGETVKRTYSFKKINDQGSTETIDISFWFQDLLPS
jgi:uncharacterized protein (TIGR00290 family)